MIMPTRIQRKRTMGWRMPANTVYVGRPSKWSNPFVVQWYMDVGYSEREARAEAVRDFRMSIEDPVIGGNLVMALFIDVDAHFDRIRADIEELRGKNLACWCRLDEPCHADVLLEMANGPACWGRDDGRHQADRAR